ncbi:MAG: radical SAM protein [Acidobacteria bacterium]|nr:radical SAM protein [Acidobacteriota bacterium]
MKTCLHLVAMPLAYPMHPSSQLGYLHGYIEQEFKDRVPVRSHSAYLDILCNLEGESMTEFFEKYSLLGEELLFLVCCYRAARRGRANTPPGKNFAAIWKLYHEYQSSELNVSQQEIVPISKRKIAALNDTMESYLEQKLIPSLLDGCLNVVGFTATFCQVFGSIFAASYIREHTSKQVLFVFGGSSFALPEATRTLERWGVDGLMVAGSGEAPLTQILESCLELKGDESRDPTGAIDSRDLINVTRVGSPRKPIDLNMAKSFMGTIPDPNYDEYFANLRSHCDDEGAYEYAVSNFVSVPLEGSRGCFARCDFCHNPDITSEFRTLTGPKVAERAIRMCEKYGRRDVTFVDSVCNTWAEQYADTLLAQDNRIGAFMEMRVHEPESFWTKLSLSGVRAVQLGVEAISEPLLQNMRKGTKVLQNLSATKYMAEMGLANPSNLIIHHPKSTVADVEETERIMMVVEHFPICLLSLFVVSYASPIYKELDEDRKSQLIRGFDWLPHELREYSWPRHLSYTYPPEWIGAEVVAAWRSFQTWYDEHVKGVLERKPVFTVEKARDGLLFVDTRFGQDRRYTLSGDFARVYGICHSVSKAPAIAEQSGLSLAVVDDILRELVDRAMIVKVGERYLSLALRPREELVENLLRKKSDERLLPRASPPQEFVELGTLVRQSV